jgi:excisionase family DNA binding protein
MSDPCNNKAEAGAAQQSLPRLAYKLREAAAMLGVSQSTIRDEIRGGRMKSLKRLRHVLIPAAELTRWVEEAR